MNRSINDSTKLSKQFQTLPRSLIWNWLIGVEKIETTAFRTVLQINREESVGFLFLDLTRTRGRNIFLLL